jgi:hypothetical protein
MELDGQQQRNALTAAERAVEALGAGAPDRAVSNATKAAELDQIGAFADLPSAVAAALADLEKSGAVSEAGWSAVREAVPPGPLQALVDSLRA